MPHMKIYNDGFKNNFKYEIMYELLLNITEHLTAEDISKQKSKKRNYKQKKWDLTNLHSKISFVLTSTFLGRLASIHLIKALKPGFHSMHFIYLLVKFTNNQQPAGNQGKVNSPLFIPSLWYLTLSSFPLSGNFPWFCTHLVFFALRASANTQDAFLEIGNCGGAMWRRGT